MIHRPHRPAVLTVFLAAVLAVASAEAAPPRLVLVCYPGGPVRARDAQPAMESMLRVIEETGHWPQGSLTAEFTSKVDACRALMKQKQPHFAILSTGLYLEHRDAHHLVPVAQPNIRGKTTDTYRILVRKGTFGSLEDLEGKTLGGTLLTEPRFLKKIVFENRIDPAAHFELAPSRRALRALRKLDRGKLDAVMVNDQQYRSLDSLPFSDKLEVVFTSDPLPLVGLVADERKTSRKDRARLTQSLTAMCTHAKGKELCKLFGVEAFVPADTDTYKNISKLWRAD